MVMCGLFLEVEKIKKGGLPSDIFWFTFGKFSLFLVSKVKNVRIYDY